MSPKKIAKLTLIVAGISVVGIPLMLMLRPDWGWLAWWPALGLGLALLLLVASFLRGAYLSAQRQVAMVDKLNDCYAGITETGETAN